MTGPAAGTWTSAVVLAGIVTSRVNRTPDRVHELRALEALSEAGLRVPDDIALAGYDNTSIAALGPISLTSVDQAGHRIGTIAARLLLERLDDRNRPATQIKLAPTHVPRRSTAPPRSV